MMKKLFLACVLAGMMLLGTMVMMARADGPIVVDLDLQEEDIRIIGADELDWLGEVTASGDINGDGYDDLIVGAAGADYGGRPYCGAVYVILGRSEISPTWEMADGSANVTIYGASPNDFLGHSINVGDVNGDGLADLIIGADGYGDMDGAVYVFIGSTDDITTTSSVVVDLSTSSEITPSLIVYGQSGERLGRSVYAGNVNNDTNSGHSIKDIIIGAYYSTPYSDTSRVEAGTTYVIMGRTDLTTTATIEITATQSAAMTILGAEGSDRLGRSVSGGDINGDGYADLIVGAQHASSPITDDVGVTYVITGSAGITTSSPITFDLSATTDTNKVFVYYGAEPGDETGFYVGSGDFNNDNLDDVLIGAYLAESYWEGSETGQAYVVFGRDPLSHTVALSTGADVTIYGGEEDERLSRSLASGDINGDGYDDIILGSSQADRSETITDTGRVYVISGGSSISATINLSETNAVAYKILGDDGVPPGYQYAGDGRWYGDECGRATAAGDINGDGVDDVIAGGGWAEGAAGEAYVIYGGGPFTLSIAPTNQTISSGQRITYTVIASDTFNIRNVSAKTTFTIEVGADGSWGDNIYTAGVSGTWMITATYRGAVTTTLITVTNAPPTVDDATFAVDENSANGTSVGTVSANDPDAGDSLSYAITTGNTGDAFTIGSTGEISVSNSSALDYETTPTFNLTVVVTDTGGLTDNASITVTVNDVNEAPTDIGLDSTDVDENEAINTVVGNLSTTDQDSGDTFTYTLETTGGCAGLGPDNGSFNIDAAQLRTGAVFDYETTDTYTICVRTDDGHGGIYDEQFVITVNDVNEAPTDIGLDSTDVDENEAINTVVGNLSTTDQDSGDSHSYSLVNTGPCPGPDNGSFNINAAQLRTGAVFDYEITGTYTVCVRTDDGHGGAYDEQFVITVNDVNEAPTDIGLDSTDVDENEAINTVVGNLSTTDQDSGDTFTYTLETTGGCAGLGPDNGSFNIDAAQLRTGAVFDYETTNTYTICVRTDDGHGGAYDEQFVITVNDVNEAPTDIGLDSTDVDENEAINTVVGNLSTTDQDSGDTFTYTLETTGGCAGLGPDNGSFNIDAAQLRTGAVFDYEITGTYTVCVRTDDGHGGAYDEQFVITVNDVNEAPTDIGLDSTDVDENEAINTVVGNLSTTDQDSGDTFTYTLETTGGCAGLGPDNGSFNIDAAQLRTGAVFDYEITGTYTVCVRTDDGHGGTYDEQFVITVNDANDDPTDIGLDSTDVDENEAINMVVGNLSTTDQDSGDTHTYSLENTGGCAGLGPDNGSFNIDVAQLRTGAVFDYETTDTYTVCVCTDDGHGGTYDEQFVITVNDVNEAPTDIGLDSTDVDENEAINTVVGNLSTTDQDSGDTHTYTLETTGGCAGLGPDNGSFNIDAAQLRTGAVFDYEITGTYTICVRTDDGHGGAYDEQFVITVNDVNDDPTDIGLDSNSVDENEAVDTVVGNLSTTDQDGGDTHSYSLVNTGPCPGPDNGSFNINAAQLRTGAVFDYEITGTYTVCVRTDDGHGGAYDEQFVITVNDVNDPPTDIGLDSTDVDENQPVDTVVGNLSTTDQDSGDSHTYSLVNTGPCPGPDNGSFNINVAQLRTGAVFDYEITGTYTVCVRTDDGHGGAYDEQFVITVNDVNEAPTDIGLDSTDVDENEAINTVVGNLSTTDQDSGDTFTYTLETTGGCAGLGPDNGSFNIDAAQLRTGAVFDYEITGTYTVCVRTDDGHGGTYDEQFVITVNDANDDPTDIGLDSTDVDENEAINMVVGNLSTTDQDSGDTHTYSLENTGGCAGLGPDNGSFNIDVAQLRTGAVFDYETTDTYTVCVCTDDGHGGTYDEQFVITVNDVNEAPTDIGLDSTDVDENEAINTVVGNLSTTDQDSGDTHTYTLETTGGCAGLGPDNGSFNIDAAQLRTGAVFDYEITGTYTICVRTDDGHGGAYDEQFVITVNDVNDDPTDIGLDSNSVDENEAVDTVVGNLSTTDQDGGDTHSYSLVNTGPCPGPDNGSFNINAAQLRTGAVFDYEITGTYTVCVRTDDGHGGAYDEQFVITVNDVNDPPTDIGLDSTDVDENQPVDTVVGNLSTTDQDSGDSHTYSLVNTGPCPGPDNGSFNINVAQLRTGAVFDYEITGTYTVCVRTDDGHGGAYDEQFVITVNDVNEAPTDIGLDSTDVDENEAINTVVGNLSTTDQDSGDTHTYTLETTGGCAGLGPDNGSFNIDAAQLRTGAVFDYEITGTYTVCVRTDDGHGGAYDEQFVITVNDVNEAPTDIGLDSTDVDENEAINTVVGNLSTTDQDSGDTHTYTLENTGGCAGLGPDNGSFNIDAAQLRTGAVFDYETTNTYTICVRTDDGHGGAYDEQFVITVNDANDDPTGIGLDSTDVDENEAVDTVVGNLSTTDQDSGDIHTYSLVNTGPCPGPDNGSFNINAAQLRTSAVFDYETTGTYTVCVRTDDGHGGAYDEQFVITVNDVNEAPTANDDAYSTPEDVTLTISAPGVLDNDADADSDPLTATLESGPANGTLGLNLDGSFTYTPTTSFSGDDTFTYIASDGVLTDTATVTITVSADAPTANDDGYTTDEDVTLSVPAPGVLDNDTDPNSDPLTATLESGPVNGTLALNVDGSFTYTPTANYNGSDSFTYRATDGTYNSSPATVAITVTVENDAPVATDNDYATPEDTPRSGNVISDDTGDGVDSDADGDSLTAVKDSDPANGTLSLNSDGSFVYTPTLNYNGVVTFTYHASDAISDSNTALVTITVNPALLDYIVICTDANGQSPAGAHAMTTDETWTLYAAGYDAGDNFIANQSVTWMVSGGIGVVVPTSGISTTLDATTAGTGRVSADHATAMDDETGDIAVSAGASGDTYIYLPLVVRGG